MLALQERTDMDPKTGKPIIVPERDSGKRLDAFLSAYLKRESESSAPSRALIRASIEAGSARVGGLVERNPKRRLLRGDAVSFLPASRRTELLPDPDLPVSVLFEDDDLLVIGKPAGIATHPVSFGTKGTVANWAISYVPEIREIGDDPLRPGIVHRLDRNTSGILVLAKTARAFDELKRIFSDRLATKRYQALVLGHVPETEGDIAFSIAPRSGTLRRQAILPGKDVPHDAREAFSHYVLKRRFPEADLLEVSPKTGRTHQIRVHLSAIGCPVLGDRMYGGRRMARPGIPPRQLLHAGFLSFPWNDGVKTFESPLPEDFRETLSALDEPGKTLYVGKDSNGTIRQ